MSLSENIYFPNTEFIVAGPQVNVKQMRFFEDFNFKQDEGFRYFFYGGAIRGGKSYVVLFILHLLCLKYPGSKWVVVRNTLPNLKKTTIPSFLKMLGKFQSFHGRMTYGAPHIYKYKNSSEIQFIPESITIDKDLTAFLGLECNGMFLEQIEELSQKMFDMAKQRSGSLYVVPMPPGFIFSTFNPTRNWVKKVVYERHIAGTLEKPYYYMSATPLDNPHVTQDQWSAWRDMDPKSYSQMIEGDWDATDSVDRPFITADTSRLFNPQLSFDPRLPIWVSFDINNEPLTGIISQCSDGQHSKTSGFIRTFDEFKISNDVLMEYKGWDKYMVICHLIRKKYPNAPAYITGDSSGWQGNAMFKADEPSMYIYVAKMLRSNPQTMLKTPKYNLKHTVSKTLCNSALSFHPQLQINPNTCPVLANEIKTAQTDENGKLIKDRESNPLDSFDAWRYQLSTVLYPYWLKNAAELM